jgi:hypothetical protein
MPRRQDDHTPLQALFVRRFARLVALYQRYPERTEPPDQDVALIRRALHSTMVDCIFLNVDPEAEALLPPRAN